MIAAAKEIPAVCSIRRFSVSDAFPDKGEIVSTPRPQC
jgi:hypothetical protein